MIESICICGAGTMGSGIAQVCAMNGMNTIIYDLNEKILTTAKSNIAANLDNLANKNRITRIERQTMFERIQFVNESNYCCADLIIEAIVEKLEVKVKLFNQLSELNNAEVIFATNTSSLSVSAIQKHVLRPSRVIGMHFFNPAPVMKLVEVVQGNLTSDEVVQVIMNLAIQLGKTPVKCKDAPGFIVNRVARHYYLEAMRLVEQGTATIENIDAIMEATGFKMGPFKLMDMIGMDINLSVSQSLYDAFDHESRFRPSAMQVEKVEKGELGKKSGKGFYQY